MKTVSLLNTLALYCLLASNEGACQSTYTSANYADVGDTVYITKAQFDTLNFDTTGAGITWDFSSLTGVSQRTLEFKDPTNTGFTLAQWPYIFNPTNVNLASTDNLTITVGSFQLTGPNEYFHLSTSYLEQRALSYKIAIGTTELSVKTVYSSSDIVFQFPLNFGNTYTSNAFYNTSIPGVYYRESTINRTTTVQGWGTLSTPYGTFTNCLKLVSDVIQIDSTQIDTVTIPIDTVYYREYKWLDPSKNYPLLMVKQIKTGSIYVTQTIEYYDIKRYFQPLALFAYVPIAPIQHDTVKFQNLSLNATTYQWNFGDPSSGTLNTSTLQNPQHIYSASGIYPVTLISFNGSLSDTTVLPVVVGAINPPLASFTYSPLTIYEEDTVFFNNTSVDGLTYLWDFGDPASGSENVSVLPDPIHVYNSMGVYIVTLITYNNISSDTTTAILMVDSLSTVGLPEFISQNLTVFPNPANRQIQIHYISHNYRVNFYNNYGELVYTTTPANGSINISTIPNGVYVLELVEPRQTPISRKMVIQHE